MADEFIPEDIKEFIVGRIHSIAQLEGLLLLRRDPQVKWEAEALAGRLYISQQETTEVLSHLLHTLSHGVPVRVVVAARLRA
jgi:hypothetical protein